MKSAYRNTTVGPARPARRPVHEPEPRVEDRSSGWFETRLLDYVKAWVRIVLRGGR